MKILLAIDGSPCSAAAIRTVAEWPWPHQSEVRVITVDAPVDPGLFRGSPGIVFDDMVRQQREVSEKFLREAADVLKENPAGLRVTTALIIEGWPKDAIVTEAQRYGADVLAIGSHGHGPLRRLFLGSVSLFVAQRAPCSVLIVREPPNMSSIRDV